MSLMQARRGAGAAGGSSMTRKWTCVCVSKSHGGTRCEVCALQPIAICASDFFILQRHQEHRLHVFVCVCLRALISGHTYMHASTHPHPHTHTHICVRVHTPRCTPKQLPCRPIWTSWTRRWAPRAKPLKQMQDQLTSRTASHRRYLVRAACVHVWTLASALFC